MTISVLRSSLEPEQRFSLERERDSPRRVKYWAILEDPRLSERFSPGRERLTWEGKIQEYTRRFSPGREIAFWVVDTVRFSLERESLA
ncbi:hypothetical protein Lal_00015272 [Lupinus albus]|nr:hypothetical protein Lal_00015272 [Lupinus albus]